MALLEAEQARPRTGGKDSALRDWVRALEATAPIAGNPQRILPRVIEELAQTRGDAPALLSAGECLTYRALDDRANRYARWALAQDLGKGETVCLVMPNRPEYLAIWLGITRVGGVVSLINTNLRGTALAHCLDIVTPKHIIVAVRLAAKSAPRLRPWRAGRKSGRTAATILPASTAPSKLSGERLTEAERRGVTIADRALHIYTSGTTGLPKAANVSHHRLMQWSFWFAGLMNTGPDDRMYDCLPLYHSVGGVVATGAVLVRGGSVVIREKFSAREFWDDVVDWDCTLFQYIGELCRYLANAPEHPREKQHRLRLVLRQRAARRRLAEIPGPIRHPENPGVLCGDRRQRLALQCRGQSRRHRPRSVVPRPSLSAGAGEIRSGNARAGPRRDGLCVRCATGERARRSAEFTTARLMPAAEFEGYTDAEASQKKILRDVFERGDAWYRTGDLMREDASGFFYFVDRIGDTFRWKGENVATRKSPRRSRRFPASPRRPFTAFPFPAPRAPPAWRRSSSTARWICRNCASISRARLPAYARPLFLRIKDRIEVTATFKHQKNELAREGFDPGASGDAIYFDDPSQRAYVRLDGALYERIKAGEVRL